MALRGDNPLPSSINIPFVSIPEFLRNSIITSAPEAVDPLFLNFFPNSFIRCSANRLTLSWFSTSIISARGGEMVSVIGTTFSVL